MSKAGKMTLKNFVTQPIKIFSHTPFRVLKFSHFFPEIWFPLCFKEKGDVGQQTATWFFFTGSFFLATNLLHFSWVIKEIFGAINVEHHPTFFSFFVAFMDHHYEREKNFLEYVDFFKRC